MKGGFEVARFTYSEYMSEDFIQDILSPYLASMKNKRTAVEYVGYLRLLCNKVCKDFLDITSEDAYHVFEAWKSLMRSGELSRKTICVRLACYNSISKFIQEKLDYPDFVNPFDSIARPEVVDTVAPNKTPTMREVDMIVSQTKDNPMYYLIMALVTRACIPSSKITRITLNSIVREDGKVALLFKNNTYDSHSVVVLPGDVVVLLDSYLSTLSEVDEKGHIFYNARGNALTLKNLDTAISKYVKKSGVGENYTIKDIRTRAILELVAAGASENSVMQYTGLGPMRTQQFFEVKAMLSECPADLVNYRMCVS